MSLGIAQWWWWCFFGGALNVTFCVLTVRLCLFSNVCVTVRVVFNLRRVVTRRLPVWLSEIFTVLLWPAFSVVLALPTVTTILCLCARDVIAITRWPRTVSVIVSRNDSLHLLPAAPVHDAFTLAVLPDTLACPKCG